MRRISAADANRHFAKILREVRAGGTVTITTRGTEVAVIAPIGSGSDAYAGAKKALLDRLRRQPSLDEPRWSRDELYERGRS